MEKLSKYQKDDLILNFKKTNMKNRLIVLFIIVSQTNAFGQPFPIPPTSNHSGGEYRVYRSPTEDTITLNNLRKSIIWVEGFDANNHINTETLYNQIDQGTLAAQLHTAGYDIIVLNFNDGGDFIERNALVLQQLIQEINANKPPTDELVVIGFSMGGLVARYALVNMENMDVDHETRMYISYDSPHNGAHIPVGIQALALTSLSPSYQSLFPELEEIDRQFNSPAATQMLRYRLTSATQNNQVLQTNPDHIVFTNQINSLNSNGGFPTMTDNIGISLGSWTGTPQRASFDTDKDGFNDYQYSGFSALFINAPQAEASPNIWELNQCEINSTFFFQSFLSTTIATDYPYHNDRSAYFGPQNSNYASYWYSNSFGLSLFPLGAWSRIYSYENGEAMDFAPGSFSTSCEQIAEGFNTSDGCTFAYYDRSTFVPTVSALAYNTTNLFHKISNDPNRLSKTPFDEIFGFCGDGHSHDENETTNFVLVNWLLSKIQGYPTPNVYCDCDDFYEFSATRNISGTSSLCTSNSNYSTPIMH